MKKMPTRLGLPRLCSGYRGPSRWNSTRTITGATPVEVDQDGARFCSFHLMRACEATTSEESRTAKQELKHAGSEALMSSSGIDLMRMVIKSTRQSTSRRKVIDNTVRTLNPYIPLKSETGRKSCIQNFWDKSYHLVVHACVKFRFTTTLILVVY